MVLAIIFGGRGAACCCHSLGLGDPDPRRGSPAALPNDSHFTGNVRQFGSSLLCSPGGQPEEAPNRPFSKPVGPVPPVFAGGYQASAAPSQPRRRFASARLGHGILCESGNFTGAATGARGVTRSNM